MMIRMLYEKKITERDQQSLKCFTVGIIDIICIELTLYV